MKNIIVLLMLAQWSMVYAMQHAQEESSSDDSNEFSSLYIQDPIPTGCDLKFQNSSLDGHLYEINVRKSLCNLVLPQPPVLAPIVAPIPPSPLFNPLDALDLDFPKHEIDTQHTVSEQDPDLVIPSRASTSPNPLIMVQSSAQSTATHPLILQRTVHAAVSRIIAKTLNPRAQHACACTKTFKTFDTLRKHIRSLTTRFCTTCHKHYAIDGHTCKPRCSQCKKRFNTHEEFETHIPECDALTISTIPIWKDSSS